MKVGNKLYLPAKHPDYVKEVTITKVGRKYYYAEGYKIDKSTLQDRDGWTFKEFSMNRQEVYEKERESYLWGKICRFFSAYIPPVNSLKLLEDVYKKIQKFMEGKQ